VLYQPPYGFTAILRVFGLISPNLTEENEVNEEVNEFILDLLGHLRASVKSADAYALWRLM